MLPFLRLRKGIPTHNTALTMVAPRAGQAVLVLGGEDPALIVAIGQVTGLNGRTVVVVDTADTHRRVDAAATDAGTLIEILDAALTTPLAGDAAYDVVIVQAALAGRPAAARAGILDAAVRAARPGGRVVVIEGGRKTGAIGAFTRARPALDGGDVVELLQRAGLIAVRQLGAADGQTFYEGRARA